MRVTWANQEADDNVSLDIWGVLIDLNLIAVSFRLKKCKVLEYAQFDLLDYRIHSAFEKGAR